MTSTQSKDDIYNAQFSELIPNNNDILDSAVNANEPLVQVLIQDNKQSKVKIFSDASDDSDKESELELKYESNEHLGDLNGSRSNSRLLQNRQNESICSLLMSSTTKQTPQINDIIYKPVSTNLSSFAEKISSRLDGSNKRITLNIGGVRFETYYGTLKLIEESRLAQLTETNSDFDPVTNEYFFDRDPNAFLAILNYYRTGKLHAPSDICGNLFFEELNYWGISEKKIQPCCWTKYSATRDCDEILRNVMDNIENKCDVEIDNWSSAESDSEIEVPTLRNKKTIIRHMMRNDPDRNRRNHCLNRISRRLKRFYHIHRRGVWKFFDDRKSSIWAYIFFWFSVIVLVVSLISFVLATTPYFRIPYDVAMNKSLTRKERENGTVPHPVLHIIEFSCNLFFSCEFVLRFLSSPNKVKFLRNLYNIFEFLAILPILLPAETHTNKNLWTAKLHSYIEVFYILRILRIFTLVPKYSGLRVLLLTLKNSLGELILYVLMLIMTIMIFASFVFYAEQIFEQDDNKFDSILISLWWAIVTLTTLGYGDIVPATPFGYMVGSLCALSGLIFLALPIPIIVNNFATYYLHVKARQKLRENQDNMPSSTTRAITQHFQDYNSNENSIDRAEIFLDQNAFLMWKECKRRTIRRPAIFDNRTYRKMPQTLSLGK